MTVLRKVVGETLRGLRLRQRRTLREVSSSARVSLGYLSEVERGQKEPSSELLAAICTALDVELLRAVPRSDRHAAPRGEARRQRRRLASRVPAAPGPESNDSPQMRALPTVAA